MMRGILHAALAAGLLSLSEPLLGQEQASRFLQGGTPASSPLKAAPIFENIGQASAQENSLETRVQSISAKTGIGVPSFMLSLVRLYSEIITDYQELQRFERSYLKLSLIEQKNMNATLYFYQAPSFPGTPDLQTLPVYLHVQIRM